MSPSTGKGKKMSTNYNDIPFGIKWIQKIADRCRRIQFKRELLFKISVLVLTYMAYTCYHMTRKPISVVKSVLHRNCSGLDPPSWVKDNDTTWCSYAPFDGEDATTLFGALDSSFLFSYSAAMFVSGFVAERVSLRYFLALGMLLSGIFTYLFGMAKPYSIHSLWYFVIVQVVAGVVQTTGWPGVVTVVGRWFGKSKHGLIFGIWNSHTSIGNILGTLIAAYYVEKDWSMSFIVPGLIMGCVGFLLFLFLVDSPDLVGCQERPLSGSLPRVNGDNLGQTTIPTIAENSSDEDVEAGRGEVVDDSSTIEEPKENENPSVVPTTGSVNNSEVNFRPNERTPMLGASSTSHSTVASQSSAINLIGALSIPGVIEFSLCLFFSKLVSYTFLYWLPLYIQSSTTFGAKLSADISTIFDVGGIVGAVTAGAISDYTSMPAATCSALLFFAAPVLLIYHQYGTVSLPISVFLLFVCGILVNGPYALITTSVSAELGTHSSLEGNSKALATVTAIIDGTGSIGAAVGPLLAGLISRGGWHRVFYMLIISDIIALLLLVRLLIKEFVKLKRNERRE